MNEMQPNRPSGLTDNTSVPSVQLNDEWIGYWTAELRDPNGNERTVTENNPHHAGDFQWHQLVEELSKTGEKITRLSVTVGGQTHYAPEGAGAYRCFMHLTSVLSGPEAGTAHYRVLEALFPMHDEDGALRMMLAVAVWWDVSGHSRSVVESRAVDTEQSEG